MLPWFLDVLGVRLPLGCREEGGQRRLEFGLRIGPAALGIEEARTVDQAGMAWSQQIRAIVAEVEPRAMLRQAPVAGPLDQLLQITGAGRRGRPGQTDQKGDDGAEPP